MLHLAVSALPESLFCGNIQSKHDVLLAFCFLIIIQKTKALIKRKRDFSLVMQYLLEINLRAVVIFYVCYLI